MSTEVLDAMPDSEIQLDLSRDEALVFFEWLSRFNKDEDSKFADQAEQRVLWAIEAQLMPVGPSRGHRHVGDLAVSDIFDAYIHQAIRQQSSEQRGVHRLEVSHIVGRQLDQILGDVAWQRRLYARLGLI